MAQKNNSKVNYRISRLYGFLLLLLAFSYDLYEFAIDALGTLFLAVGAGFVLYILNFITGIIIAVLFWILFAIKDVSLGKTPRRIAISAITFVVEQIPGLDTVGIASFGWTLGVLIIILTERSADKGGWLSRATSLARSIKNAKKKKDSEQQDKGQPNK